MTIQTEEPLSSTPYFMAPYRILFKTLPKSCTCPGYRLRGWGLAPFTLLLHTNTSLIHLAPCLSHSKLRSAFRGLSFRLSWLQCGFQVERQRAAAKVIPLTNHRRCNQCNKSIRKRNNLMWLGNARVQVMIGFHWLKKGWEFKKKWNPDLRRRWPGWACPRYEFRWRMRLPK